MKYVSTRGSAPKLEFEDVLLQGLAQDGGLYVPETWPSIAADEIAGMQGLPYVDVAQKIITPFVGDAIGPDELRAMLVRAYGSFAHEAVTPLVELDSKTWLLELFHGPTLSFKDVAMQLLGQLFDHALQKRGEWITIVGATSGDTGSAAIEAMRGRESIDIFILHPHGRVSDVQRRQMTTVQDSNVFNIAIDGTFDDCQSLVKAMFNEKSFHNSINMAAVNSINWARIMAQVVYYFYAAVALGGPHRKMSFCVPTGNFGDVFAGYVAGQMGLPISRLIVATNVNDILVRTLTSGRYEVAEVVPTVSPAMDIQVSSNFERLLFDAYDRDAMQIAGLMSRLANTGKFELSPDALAAIRGRFTAIRVDEQATKETIARTYASTGQLVDPHSAVGLSAAAVSRRDPDEMMVSLSTAHPAKFPDAVEAATGTRASLPDHLQDIEQRTEQFERLPNDLEKVKDQIRENSRARH